MNAKLLKRDIKKLRRTQKQLANMAKKAYNRKDWKKAQDCEELIALIELKIKEAEVSCG